MEPYITRIALVHLAPDPLGKVAQAEVHVRSRERAVKGVSSVPVVSSEAGVDEKNTENSFELIILSQHL